MSISAATGSCEPGDPNDPLACCTPLSREALSAEKATQIAPLLKALADPVRLRLLSMVLSHEGGEACVCDLLPAFDLSQPTISHHLKILHEAGILDREKRGVWVYYQARPEAMEAMVTLFANVSNVSVASPSPAVSAAYTASTVPSLTGAGA